MKTIAAAPLFVFALASSMFAQQPKAKSAATQTEAKVTIMVTYNSMFVYGPFSGSSVVLRKHNGATERTELAKIPEGQGDRRNEHQAKFIVTPEELVQGLELSFQPTNGGALLVYKLPTKATEPELHRMIYSFDSAYCKEQPTYLLYPKYAVGETIWPQGKPKPGKCSN